LAGSALDIACNFIQEQMNIKKQTYQKGQKNKSLYVKQDFCLSNYQVFAFLQS
jgi:hypothetical protein